MSLGPVPSSVSCDSAWPVYVQASAALVLLGEALLLQHLHLLCMRLDSLRLYIFQYI